jgi:hypothetical protein
MSIDTHLPIDREDAPPRRRIRRPRLRSIRRGAIVETTHGSSGQGRCS